MKFVHKNHNNFKNSNNEFKITTIISTISIVLSIFAIIISVFEFKCNLDQVPLSYYLKPQIVNFVDNTLQVEVEAIVTNGAIGDVKVIDYRNGEVSYVANNVGGTIRKK